MNGWKPPPRGAGLRELFTPEWRRVTLSGTAVAVVAMLTWWGCNAFIPLVAGGLVLGHQT